MEEEKILSVVKSNPTQLIVEDEKTQNFVITEDEKHKQHVLGIKRNRQELNKNQKAKNIREEIDERKFYFTFFNSFWQNFNNFM